MRQKCRIQAPRARQRAILESIESVGPITPRECVRRFRTSARTACRCPRHVPAAVAAAAYREVAALYERLGERVRAEEMRRKAGEPGREESGPAPGGG